MGMRRMEPAAAEAACFAGQPVRERTGKTQRERLEKACFLQAFPLGFLAPGSLLGESSAARGWRLFFTATHHRGARGREGPAVSPRAAYFTTRFSRRPGT